MRIGIDATPLRARGTGIARYTEQLIRGLAGRAPEVELVLFGRRDRDGIRAPEGVTWDPIDFPGKRWLDPFHLPGARRRIDLFHGTNYLAPLCDRVPCVLTVHDMTVYLQPETHPWMRRFRHRLWLPALCRRGARIIADSANTRSDVMRLLRVPSERITVTPLAVEARFRPVENAAERERVRRRHELPAEYLLYVGALEPRKNLPALLDAIAALRRERSVPPLVLAGRGDGRYVAHLEEHARSRSLLPGRDVRLLGYVEEEDLPALYSQCSLFLYPSLYEGFGLPPLEAMACGAPALVAEGSSLGELYAHCSLVVARDALAPAIARALDDAALRSELSERGQVHARARSWDAVVDETLAVYRSALAAA